MHVRFVDNSLYFVGVIIGKVEVGLCQVRIRQSESASQRDLIDVNVEFSLKKKQNLIRKQFEITFKL